MILPSRFNGCFSTSNQCERWMENVFSTLSVLFISWRNYFSLSLCKNYWLHAVKCVLNEFGNWISTKHFYSVTRASLCVCTNACSCSYNYTVIGYDSMFLITNRKQSVCYCCCQTKFYSNCKIKKQQRSFKIYKQCSLKVNAVKWHVQVNTETIFRKIWHCILLL